MSPEEFRQTQMQHGLSRAAIADDPIRQFQRWYRQAIDTGIPEPGAMSLATVSAHGEPSLRTVLLKRFDRHGFVFFTNYASRKARDIAANPHVALLFPWVSLGRQVKIMGRAEKLSFTDSLRYFSSRPRGSQIGAWASPQSRAIDSRASLDAHTDRLQRAFADTEVPLPAFWGGYRVTPAHVEFWQSRQNRLHDRFLYTRTDDRWNIERLAP